uniref:hypothetical protein n=1 Tax=Thaumasiovibrio occultus TaxID=1891184 RepID=UPI000B34BAC0|nr:hypothetical protein [Thaumasiovibrio occultus]
MSDGLLIRSLRRIMRFILALFKISIVLMIIGSVMLAISLHFWESDNIALGEEYAINIGRELQQDMDNGLGCSNSFSALKEQYNSTHEIYLTFYPNEGGYPHVSVSCYPDKGTFSVSAKASMDYYIDVVGGVNSPLSLSEGYPTAERNSLIDVETGQRIQQQ